MRVLRKLAKSFSGVPEQFLIAPAQVRLLDAIQSGGVENFSISADPTVVSYGTRDGVYDVYAQRLLETCRAVGMAVSVETIPRCSRDNACLFKPTFIKMKLLTIGGPVIWLDADAILTAKISLPTGEWDIATLANNVQSAVNSKAALCIAFNPTVAALRFLEHWEQLCSAHWLRPGLDHRRFNYAREILSGQIVEQDLTEAVHGRLVRDAGKEKERAF